MYIYILDPNVCQTEREREREREDGRTDRQTDTQTDTQTEFTRTVIDSRKSVTVKDCRKSVTRPTRLHRACKVSTRSWCTSSERRSFDANEKKCVRVFPKSWVLSRNT